MYFSCFNSGGLEISEAKGLRLHWNILNTLSLRASKRYKWYLRIISLLYYLPRKYKPNFLENNKYNIYQVVIKINTFMKVVIFSNNKIVFISHLYFLFWSYGPTMISVCVFWP